VDAIHGEYFDNSRNRPYYYRFDLCWAHWFRYSAELGSMRVTEQIDAMEVSGTNPFKFSGHANHGYHFNASYTCLLEMLLFSDRIWLKI
jgi:hypothetical protein